MKYFCFLTPFLSLLVVACNNDEDPNVYTGNRVTYELVQSSEFPVSGTATFMERRDGMTEIEIELAGLEGDIDHPAHLHYGEVSVPDAPVAVLLTPVNGLTGRSVTKFDKFIDENPITYSQLLDFDGHIKVHLDGDANKHIILASGNIGGAATGDFAGG